MVHYFLVLVLLTFHQRTECCIESNLSPTHSKWAIGYNGTMYSAGFSGRSSFNWKLSFLNEITDSVEYQWCQVESICGEPHYDTKPFNSTLLFSTVNTSLADYTSTTFGSMAPLNQTFNNSVLELIIEGNRCDQKNIIVTECLDSLKDGVKIICNDDPIYDTKGVFYCLNNGVLFDKNEKEQTNNETKCLSDATWEGQDGLQCWKAPLVTLYVLEEIMETFTFSENSTIQLNCSYAETTPVAKSNRYYLGDILLNETLPNATFSFNVKREDDKKSIYCQAITPFTEIYVETGKSENLILNVLYGPSNANLIILNTVEIDSMLFVNKSLDVNLTCESDANPTAICLWSLPPNTSILKNQNCSMLVNFMESGEVNCTAMNSQNTTSSERDSITFVGERDASISTDFVGPQVLEESNVTLKCSVLLQNELNTMFKWSLPSDNRAPDLTKSTLSIVNLTKTDRGNYNCTNIDVFGGSTTSYFLNVLYQPYETSISADTSTSIVMTDSGLLLNSTQTVTLRCTSDSNPKANCSFDAPFTTWSESCSINREFTTSASVSCSTNNGIGNTGESQTLSVVVVEQRTSDVILGSAVEGSLQSGYDVTLNCSVPYQDDLNTIFEWTIPSDRTIDVTDSILTLNNLTRFDRGNYICQTQDAFGTSMKSFFLDVLYGASKDPGSKTTCTWSEVANNSCFLNFNSNPPTKDYLLTHGDTGEVATCQNCHFESIGSKNITQRFIFALPQTSNEAANYNLRILSSGFPDLEVTFAISDGIPIDTGDDQTVVIIASVIGGILFIVIILAALFVMRKRGIFDKKESGDSNTFNNGNGVPTSNDPEIAQTKQDKKKKKEKKAKADKNPDVYTAVDISKKSKKGSEKEERLNPLYDGVDIPDEITDAYDTVNVSQKNQSEKEDRINPLYDVGQGNSVEEAYASVDKTKKKKGKDDSSGQKKKGTAALLGFGAQNGNQDAYAEVDFNKKKKNKNKKSKKDKKEDNKAGPSYLTGETGRTQDAYATVDISKKKKKDSSEKEDRLNPLYDMGKGNGIEDAYASVDKSAKRDTSEKEDRINPLYDSYQDQPSASGSGTMDSLHANYSTTGMSDTYAVVDKQNGPSKKKKAPIKPPVKKKPDIKPPTPTKPGALKPPKPKKPGP